MKLLHELNKKIAQWMGDKTQFGIEPATPSPPVLESFFENYSVSSLLPYETYDPQTQLFVNKKSIGFMLEASTLTGATEETINILASLVTDVLPTHADLQFLLWASPKIGHILDRFEKQRSGQGEIFEWLAQKRTDYLKKGIFNSLTTNGQYIIRDFQLYIVVSIPLGGEDKQAELIDIREDLMSSLKSIQIITRNIPIENFISVLSDIINPSQNVYPAYLPWNPVDSLALQVTDPDYTVQVNPYHLDFSNESEKWEARAFTVNNFPKTMTQWKMTESLGQLFNNALQIPCPFLTSLHVRALDHEKSSTTAQMQYMVKERKARSPMAKLLPLITHEYKDWEFVRQRLADGDRLVKIFYEVILFSTPENANFSERKLRDLYRANGWKLAKNAYLQLQSWLAALPMMMTEGLYQDMKQLGRLRTMTAFNAVNIAPLQGEWKGTKTPSLLLPGRRGQLTIWDPFDNPDGNYNIAIAAKSGSGKSALTQEYIVSLVGSGGRVWIIDVGRSYEKTCRMLGGEFIEFTPDKHICLNPFTLITDINASLEILKPLLAAMARPSSTASDEEVTFLEKAIKAAWQQKRNQATITTVATWLAEENSLICKNLSHLLYSYTVDGMYGRYFEGDCTINIDNAFVVLELEELKSKKDLQKIILLVLMYQISEITYLGNRRQCKSCIIDEAWDLLGGDNEGAAKFIETGYRRARRYNANFVTITQSINDYFKNATSIAAFENSDHNFILGQKDEAIEQLKQSNRLTMDGYIERLLKSLRKTDDYSECVIKSSTGLSVHRIIFDPYSRILYSSKGDEFEMVKTLQAQGMSLRDSIAQVARKFNYAD